MHLPSHSLFVLWEECHYPHQPTSFSLFDLQRAIFLSFFFFGGGGGECHGDYGEEQARASPALGVESFVRGARGMVDGLAMDLAVVQGRTPLSIH